MAAPPPAGPQSALTGRWRKDAGASDSADAACDMVKLPRLYRQAMKLLKTLEVEDTPEQFRTVLKAGGIMDTVEEYSWSGQEVEHPRRDKRRGVHAGHVTRTERGPCIQVVWGEPYAGRGSDTFELSPDGATLTQHTVMDSTASGQHVQYKTVYHRVQ